MKQTLAFALAALSVSAHAALVTLSGQAVHHNENITIDFSVAAGSSVSLWTDSWQSGLNFDPQLYLANAGTIVNEDNDSGSLVDASAGFFDAGLQFIAVAAGSYRLVLNASSNDRLGTTLADGFTYDGDTAIKLTDWNQPGYDINANDQKGGFWRVNLNGVEQASVVPEPGSLALVLAALMSVALVVRQRQRKS